jgi:hypothetical protein
MIIDPVAHNEIISLRSKLQYERYLRNKDNRDSEQALAEKDAEIEQLKATVERLTAELDDLRKNGVSRAHYDYVVKERDHAERGLGQLAKLLMSEWESLQAENDRLSDINYQLVWKDDPEMLKQRLSPDQPNLEKRFKLENKIKEIIFH